MAVLTLPQEANCNGSALATATKMTEFDSNNQTKKCDFNKTNLLGFKEQSAHKNNNTRIVKYSYIE
jgi:hypothetical protein